MPKKCCFNCNKTETIYATWEHLGAKDSPSIPIVVACLDFVSFNCLGQFLKSVLGAATPRTLSGTCSSEEGVFRLSCTFVDSLLRALCVVVVVAAVVVEVGGGGWWGRGRGEGGER